MLDNLQVCNLQVLKKAYIEEKSNEGLPDSMAARLAWDNHKKRNQSLIVELFQVESTIIISHPYIISYYHRPPVIYLTYFRRFFLC